MSVSDLAEAVRRGERGAIARAITLVESTRRDHQTRAGQLLRALLPDSGESVRVGITGVPGVGKSTLIEALGNHVIDRGHRIAVLSIDPSSSVSGGSILGDKTRMHTLSKRAEAYIRPSPAAGNLGGVARRTREAILVLEAAGYDVVVVETVGVGQSETLVSQMTDVFLLMLLPGGGDELQGIKRGIMELADIVVVNKADGDNRAAAGRAVADYRNALRLLQRRYSHWQVPVQSCSAFHAEGIDSLWQRIESFIEEGRAHGCHARHRDEQQLHWFQQELNHGLLELVHQDSQLREDMERARADVLTRRATAADAAHRVVEQFKLSKRIRK